MNRRGRGGIDGGPLRATGRNASVAETHSIERGRRYDAAYQLSAPERPRRASGVPFRRLQYGYNIS